MTVPDTICLSVSASTEVADILVAELSDFGFDLFEFEGDDYALESSVPPAVVEDPSSKGHVTLKAYSTLPQWNVHQDHVSDLLQRYVGSTPTAAAVSDKRPPGLGAVGLDAAWNVSVIAPKNWNAAWEATIRPIQVPPFVIRPTWANASANDRELIELLIDPKMSFGTGYHETTRLVLRAISDLLRPGQSVLDAGSGTGILAIAACKLGADRVVAFDFDEWCAINAAENFARNDCAQTVTWFTGTLSAVAPGQFDLIVANINRNVLVEILHELKTRLLPNGHIVLAGLLLSDRDAMLKQVAETGLLLAAEDSEAEWWSARLVAA